MAPKTGWIILTVVGVAAILSIVASVQRDEPEATIDTGAERVLQRQPQPEKSTVKPEEPKTSDEAPAAATTGKAPQPAPAAEKETVKEPPKPPVEVPVVPASPLTFTLRAKKTDSSCPHGLLFDVEMSHENFVPVHERHVVDVAAIREATQGTKVNLKIPRVVHMINAQDQVPEGMREAMQTVFDSNPEFEFLYFSDARAQEFMDQKFPERQRNMMKTLVPTKYRAEYAMWHYLYEFGGVHLHTGFVAGKQPLIKALKSNDELVVTLDEEGKITTDFIAVTPKHPVLAKVLEWVLGNVESHNYGKDAESVTGSGPITDAFTEILKEKPSVGYDKNGVRVLQYNRKKKCLIGTILSSDGLPMFWTRYPAYGTETRWYRIRNDDAHAAWSKRHVFGNWDCPGGLTLGQENDGINQAPDRNRVLVDMSPFHAARAVAGTKQKIPRLIMQTNKADRIPKDLRKAMQTLIDMNPTYEHYYFSDARIRDFIKQHFDQKTLDAFDAVVPGAYKSDLFRYCFLYVKGGVFLDGDVQAARPIEELIRPDDEFLSAEDCGIGWVHNAFMAAIPGHPIVKKAIEMAVDRITRRDYGENPLAITGPILLRDAFRGATGQSHIKVGEYGNNIRLLSYTRQGHCMVGKIEEHGRVVLWMRYDTYKSEVRWYMAGKSYYHDMWHERRVFKN